MSVAFYIIFGSQGSRGQKNEKRLGIRAIVGKLVGFLSRMKN